LLAGGLVLLVLRVGRTSLPMALLISVPLTYVGARVSGAWTGAGMIELVSEISSERAHSLAFRIESEEKLRERAAESPVFGWGGWGRSLVRRYDDPERTETVTVDSLWIIVLGKFGILGIGSLLLGWLVPVIVLWRRCPPTLWYRARAVSAWALALVLTLYALDCLVNAMVNPVYLLIAGGLCGLVPARARATSRAEHALSTAPPVAGVQVR
jgi:O-antigen ligase